MMMRTSPVLAAVLAASLIASPAVFAAPATSGKLSGEILGDHVSGAIVHAAIDNQTIRSSAPIGADGKFAIEGLPEGVWNLAVQTEAGLHVASTPVPVRGGENRSVKISLAPAVNAQEEPVVAEPKKKKDKGGMGFWDNPLTATLFVVGTAVVVGVLVDQWTDDDEDTTSVSPSTN